jgi:hypothetical protein
MEVTKIVVSVSGGNVNGIFANNPDVNIYLVDYDNLRSEPDQDCGIPFPVESIDAFRSVAESEVGCYPGIARLIAKLRE